MSMAQEFKKFILRGNVVDLAVGVVIGAAFTKIVDSLVKDIFMPVIGLITGGFNIAGVTVGYKDAQLGIGNLGQNIITFVIVGFCMFLVVKGMNFLKKKEEAAPPPPPMPSEVLLTEIRDLLKAKA
jgi:large conductance mechanosensitive channel